ncbi:VanZ family protein [Lachnospira multipara]|uniref:VanZ family protein n=1 Tax=Lachnospira multipara TaxID=28051 RepID=UPI000403BC4E|nr:VanZ family protein [Lachnospira multipara]
MKNEKTKLLAYWFAFICYIAVVVYLVFFAESLGRSGSWATTTDNGYSYNYIPLNEIKRFIESLSVPEYREMAILNLGGNILLFLPLGFLLPTILRRIGFLGTMMSAVVLSLLIELTQLFTKLGTFDIDDIILNTFGALLGFIFFLIIRPIKN